MSSNFMMSPQTYGMQHLPPHQQSKSRAWSYPPGHIFSRSRRSITPDMHFINLEPVECKADAFTRRSYPGHGVSGPDGALALITTMPLDILYEIFSYLHPMDVLNLSRTTKRLREILIDPHANEIWWSTLESVRGLPACPPDLNVAQYASLVFDDWCQSCLSNNVQKILWECRVRYCKNCIRDHFIQDDELDLCIPEDVLIEKPEAIFPLAYIVQPRKKGNGRTKPVYFLRTAREYLKELGKISPVNEPEALAHWIEAKKELQSMRVTHAALCAYWDAHWAYRPSRRPLPSRLVETAIIIFLVLVLAVLWREKLPEVGL